MQDHQTWYSSTSWDVAVSHTITLVTVTYFFTFIGQKENLSAAYLLCYLMLN